MYDNYTIKTPKQTSHGLHLLLTFATCGAWGFVWLGVAIWNALTKDKTTVRSSHPRAWYQQPIARPYEVGPGAPVSALNPHPPMPGAPMPFNPPYVGYAPRNAPNDMAHPPVLRPANLLQCEQCPYTTAFGPAMMVHKRTDHPTDQTSYCPDCGYATDSGQTMARHIQEDHPSRPSAQ